MKRKALVSEIDWQGISCRFVLYLANSFEHLKKVDQVYGLVLNDKNEILLVSNDNKCWILPGGHVEKGETLLDTLNREVYEEAAAEVMDAKPFFYQKVYLKDKLGKYVFNENQVRFVCRLKKQDKFVKDPDCEKVKYQCWCSIKELGSLLKWGDTVGFIQKEIQNLI